jgi:hypothetical protein
MTPALLEYKGEDKMGIEMSIKTPIMASTILCQIPAPKIRNFCA